MYSSAKCREKACAAVSISRAELGIHRPRVVAEALAQRLLEALAAVAIREQAVEPAAQAGGQRGGGRHVAGGRGYGRSSSPLCPTVVTYACAVIGR